MLGNGGPTTAALPEKPKADPACAPLAARIDGLRKEGVAERVEQAAQGKTTTVNVKRESLGKIAELNKANADYQMKCSTYTRPAGSTAQTPPAAAQAVSAAPAATAVVAKAKTAAVATVATKAGAAVPAAVSPAVEMAKDAEKKSE